LSVKVYFCTPICVSNFDFPPAADIGCEGKA
jgi:hypothetical protein